jgi:Lytic transglycolase
MRKLGILLGLFLVFSIPAVESHEPYIYKPTPVKYLKTVEIIPTIAPPSPSPSSLPSPAPSPSPEITPEIYTGDWIYDPETSFYGPGFYGNRTACGQAYTKTIMGVAHRRLPCGTLVAFRYKGKEITVPVIDRGPYVDGRTWDLSGGLCTFLNHCFTGPIEYRLVEKT